MLKIVADEHVYIAKEDSNLELWHYRFGHLGMHNVNKLMNDDMVEGMDSVNYGGKNSVCEGCVMANTIEMNILKELQSMRQNLLSWSIAMFAVQCL